MYSIALKKVTCFHILKADFRFLLKQKKITETERKIANMEKEKQ